MTLPTFLSILTKRHHYVDRCRLLFDDSSSTYHRRRCRQQPLSTHCTFICNLSNRCSTADENDVNINIQHHSNTRSYHSYGSKRYFSVIDGGSNHRKGINGVHQKGINGVAHNPPSRTRSNQKDDDKGKDRDGIYIQGEVLDLAINLQKSTCTGDTIQIPYELTITESIHDFWQSAFHSQDRIHTSTPYARYIGLQDRVLPFSLVLFLTSSMTHADAAKVQVGFGKAVYHWPAFAGDTFKKTFQVQSIRNTSDGNHSIIQFKCKLINQRNKVCMTAIKRMLFEFPMMNADESTLNDDDDVEQQQQQLFRNHLLSKADVLRDLGSHALTSLRPGQLIYHTMNRSISFSQSQQLASLARLTHERHFDRRKYDPKTEILIPGGLVLGLTMSASSRDLHEILHEEIVGVSYVNALHPDDVVGAITYVSSVDDVVGDLESLTVRTIGVKNMDIVHGLDGVKLPLELFTGFSGGVGSSSGGGGCGNPKMLLLPKEIERICKEKCPKLSNKVVVQVERKIIRQAMRKEIFLL